jgi:hypothetical protein
MLTEVGTEVALVQLDCKVEEMGASKMPPAYFQKALFQDQKDRLNRLENEAREVCLMS